MFENTFYCDDIKIVSFWEALFSRPEMYIGKPSLYGLNCLLTGLWIGRESNYLSIDWVDFDNWIHNKIKCNISSNIINGKCWYEWALEKANNDDELAFYILKDWFMEYYKELDNI